MVDHPSHNNIKEVTPEQQKAIDEINKLMDERIASLRVRADASAALVRQRILLREMVAPNQNSS